LPTVRVGEFEWDEAKASENLRKHGVAFLEAVTVFSDPFAIDAPDIYFPDRFVIIGSSSFGHLVFVVHAERGERIRIITARRASRAQRELYEKKEADR
jgi:uncharacterized DUF497 family protein